jgi:hypothetical protein
MRERRLMAGAARLLRKPRVAPPPGAAPGAPRAPRGSSGAAGASPGSCTSRASSRVTSASRSAAARRGAASGPSAAAAAAAAPSSSARRPAPMLALLLLLQVDSAPDVEGASPAHPLPLPPSARAPAARHRCCRCCSGGAQGLARAGAAPQAQAVRPRPAANALGAMAVGARRSRAGSRSGRARWRVGVYKSVALRLNISMRPVSTSKRA